MNKNIWNAFFSAVVFVGFLFAAVFVTPAQYRADAYAVTNARIVTGNGSVIEKGTIIVRGGLIAQIGENVTVPADAKIIPGHGPVATTKELRGFLTMLKDTSGIVDAGIKAHKTADQLKKDKALAKYDAWANGFLKADAFIDMLYKDLKR